MNTQGLLLRACMLALALVITIGASTLTAKELCNCDYGTVIVDGAVPCKFKVCFETIGLDRCEVVGPGSGINFKCNEAIAISLVDCNGTRVYLTIGCDTNVPVGPGCCVQACLDYDRNGCLLLKISPSPVDFCPC